MTGQKSDLDLEAGQKEEEEKPELDQSLSGRNDWSCDRKEPVMRPRCDMTEYCRAQV